MKDAISGTLHSGRYLAKDLKVRLTRIRGAKLPKITTGRPIARVIRRLPLHDTIVGELRVMIQTSELAPGSKINEAALCETFDISRTPLREALKVLASEGLVELRPHRGAIVAPIDPAEIGHIFQLMDALERLAGELAVRNIGPVELAELEELHSQLVAFHRAGKRNEYFLVNRRIHARLVAFAANPVLEAIYATCSTKLVRARSLVNYDAKRWQESVEEHEAIMAALRKRDARRASERLAEHSRKTGDAAIEALRRLPASESARHRVG